jgi:hypothetical protein
MPKSSADSTPRVTFEITTRQRPDFKHPLVAYVFTTRGERVDRAPVKDGKVELPIDPGRLRVFIAPANETLDEQKPTAAQLERLGAYEPVLQGGESRVRRIDIPAAILNVWPFCFCWARGKVVRASDHRAVCNARVHICEVDRIPWLIAKLPDADLIRLRDDLLAVVLEPPIPRPDPGPIEKFLARDPRSGLPPLPSTPKASVLRFENPGTLVGFNPQPDPPGSPVMLESRLLQRGALVSLNPQPLPPRERIQLATQLESSLRSPSTLVVREALVKNWKLLIPWFCYWPHWWWFLRCDEIAVVDTDAQGRFESVILYACGGDHPDLYFWVEYDFGAGFEAIYKPGVACHTYWNYICGSQVTIAVTDPRVPGCEEEPDLPGRQVVVLSIGPGVAVREVQAAGTEGLTNAGEPFGASLEPRVDFSRSELIGAGIPYYRWSYRRLSGPDGVSATVAAASVPLNAWAVMSRDVYRHYKVGTTFPSDSMGPMPTSGPGAAPAPNLFRIRPVLPPAGNEWVVLNESIDLATAYFDTDSLAGAPTSGPPFADDLAAGRYELKLELFDGAGALVNWTAHSIDLRITDQDAPFGTGTVTTSVAPAYNRVLSGADTMGFRMVVRVDNNRCSADILPVGGTVTPDPVCGFHNYNTPADIAALSFAARHANGFATYSFVVTRGPGPTIAAASTSGTAGAAGTNGYVEVSDFNYSKGVVVASLLGPCSNAAYSERLDVGAMATNGYGTLTYYNAADNAAFALALPCKECECDEAGAAPT